MYKLTIKQLSEPIDMREPDLKGACGKAWLLKAQADKPASLASWLVNRPGAHPHWQWWLVSVVHLRDVPGLPPANKQYPEAEFEFLIYSIDPTSCPNPVPDDDGGYPHLIPFDVVEHFHGIQDGEAVRLCEGAIYSIVEGIISPDQDYRPVWSQLIAGTVRHFVEGKHPIH